METPFLVICITDGELSTVHQAGDKMSAIGLAAHIAAEQTDTSREDAHREIFRDGDFLSEDGSIRIYVTQAEPSSPPTSLGRSDP